LKIKNLKMDKSIVLNLIVVAIAVIIPSVIIFNNPLNKPVEKIEEDILRLVPLGTSLGDVIKVVEANKEWKVLHRTWEPWPSGDEAYLNDTVRRRTIKLVLGKAIVSTVDVVLRFEGDGLDMKLVKVEVRKYLSI